MSTSGNTVDQSKEADDDQQKPNTETSADPDKSTDKSDQDSKDRDDSGDEDSDSDEQNMNDFDPARALRKLKKQNRELAALRARTQEAEKKANQTKEDKDKEITDLQSQLLRERVARKTGLPDQLVERLNGDDEASMLADAESLLEMFAKNRPPSSRPTEALRGGGRPDVEPEVTDLKAIAERMFPN